MSNKINIIDKSNKNDQEDIELRQEKNSIDFNIDQKVENVKNNKFQNPLSKQSNLQNNNYSNEGIANDIIKDSSDYSSNETIKKKKKINHNFKLVDTIIDDISISWYHMRIYIILSLFFMADGAEMIIISLLIKQMGDYWNLNETEKGFTGSAVFIGFLIGALIAGKISDVHGRKPVFVVGSILVCIFSVASAFANNYTVFLILRAINGFGIGISIPSSSSLATEITPTKYRSWVLNLVWVFFPVGEIFATIIAKYILKLENGWRLLLGFAAIPTILSAALCFLIYESPRYYFTIRNYDKAFIGLERMIQYRKNNNLNNTNNNFNSDIKNNISDDLSNNDDPNNIEMNNIEKDRNNQDGNNNYINDNKNQLSDVESNITKAVEEKSEKDLSQFKDNPYLNNLKKYLTFNNKITEEGRKTIKIENEIESEIKPEFRSLLKKKYIFLTILCCLIFFVCSFVYYGLVFILPQTIIYVDTKDVSNSSLMNNTFESLNNTLNNKNNTLKGLIDQENEDEMYRGVIISALSEIPSTFLTGYIGNIPFLGRKGSMIFGFILSGISSFLCSLFMKNLTIFATALKFSIGIPFGVIYLYVSEAFPTKIRAISLGVTNAFNRLGGISTPIVSQLVFSLQANNPYKIYSFLSFLAAIFCYLLPFETLGRNLS